MKKINLHLYSGLLDAKAIKIAKVLNSKFDTFYLSGIGNNKYKLKNKSSKILQIYLSEKKNLLFWYLKNFFFFKKKNIKLINVHSVGALPLGFILKIINSSKLIYDTHELETETSQKSKIKKYIAKLLEIIFIKYVDHVFVVSESISNWYHEKYKIKKPTVIYNSPILKKNLKKNILREKFKLKKNQKIFLYQGGMSKERGVELILEVFSKRNSNNAVVIFMGFGPLKKLVKKLSTKYKNIYYHPPVSREILLDYTASADFGFALLENSCLNHDYCLGNKFFEYICAGVPPIVSNLREMKKFIKFYDCGFSTNSNGKDLNNLIDRLIKINLKTKIRNCKTAAKIHCWQQQEKKLINEYKFILNDNRV